MESFEFSPNTIKLILTATLEKSGHSIQDLEDALSKMNTKEGAEKVAELLLIEVPEEFNLIKKQAGIGAGEILGLLKGLGYGTAVVGGGLGLGAYALKRQLDNEEAESSKVEAEHEKIRQATEALRNR